jgi:hypothetical protein
MSNESNTSFSWYAFVYTWIWTVPTIWDLEVRALINNSNADAPHNQTLMTLYTIPKWKVWFLKRWEVWLYGNAGDLAEHCHFQYQSRIFWKQFTVKKAINCILWWNSIYQDEKTFPDIIPALTDLKVSVVIVSKAMWVWATLDILIVDESEFTDEYLEWIGQPWY